MRIDYEVTFEPAHVDNVRLARGLSTHSLEHIDEAGFEPVAVFARDTDGRILGGVSGFLNWNWLQVSLLWVDSSLRGTGVGLRLMRMIEDIGRERGCRFAHLDTFGFQARPFYESLGYEVFAALDDYPPGHAKYFLKKELASVEND